MDALHEIYRQITKLTSTIEIKYPELYRSLNENPLTIPSTDNPVIDMDIMQDYLESLRQLVANYIETHKNKA